MELDSCHHADTWGFQGSSYIFGKLVLSCIRPLPKEVIGTNLASKCCFRARVYGKEITCSSFITSA
jgi:hypothetical protein